MFQENSIETCILSRVKQITSPDWMHETSARTWCSGRTWRERVEREVGGWIGMGKTCKLKDVSFQKIKKIKKKKNSHSRGLSSSEEKMTIYINLQIHIYTCMHAWSVSQLCLTLCDTLDCSLPRSPVHGIFQARILEWVAISSSRGPSWPRNEPTSPVFPVLAGEFFSSPPLPNIYTYFNIIIYK